MLTEADGVARWVGAPPAGVPTEGDPLQVLRGTVEALRTRPTDLPGLPPLTGGLVGFIGYDSVRRLERLPEKAVDDLHMPELGMLLATDLAVLDHEDGSVVLIANAVNWDGSDSGVDAAYESACARLAAMTADLARPAGSSAAHLDWDGTVDYTSNTTREDYMAAVASAVEEIHAGEAFQIVVSQRFSMPSSTSCSGVAPRGRLPAIGCIIARPSCTLTSASGLDPTTSKPSKRSRYM
jgi:anthranilate synthase component 1